MPALAVVTVAGTPPSSTQLTGARNVPVMLLNLINTSWESEQLNWLILNFVGDGNTNATGVFSVKLWQDNGVGSVAGDSLLATETFTASGAATLVAAPLTVLGPGASTYYLVTYSFTNSAMVGNYGVSLIGLNGVGQTSGKSLQVTGPGLPLSGVVISIAGTPTPTMTNSATNTATNTLTATATNTSTATPTQTATQTPIPTPVILITPIIPDPNLYQAIFETLQTATPNATITVNTTSLSALTRLVADNNNVAGRIYPGWVSIGGPVTSLQGLQNCVNLSILYLESNNITDLSPLAPLSITNNLIGLHLDYNNGLSDLSPIANLTHLQNLELRSGDAVGDVYFQGSLISLAPLAGLTNLTELEFSAQPVGSIAPLASLSKLQMLFMIGDSSALENSGYAGGITAISNATMPALQILYAGSRGITDISSMVGMASLVTIDLNNNPITNIAPIAGWNNAQTATFAYDNISGVLPAMAGLGSGGTALTLDLSENMGINDLSNLVATTVPGLTAAGSVLKISSDSAIPSAQITAVATAYPNLTISGP
jgi:hypothetical protein